MIPVRQIGGSDAAIACGFEAFGRNRITLWQELTGQIPRPERTSRPIRRGNSLEDWIGHEYALACGVEVRRRRKPILNDRYPWMRAHIDRRVTGSRVLLECKSVHPMALMRGENWGPDGSDEVPPAYLLQAVHYNIAANADRTDIAAMFGDELRIYPIRRDKALEARVIELEQEVWEHAIRETPPKPRTAAEVRALYPSDDGFGLVADADDLAALERFVGLRKEIKAAEAEKEELEARLQLKLAECSMLLDSEGRELCTWKQAKPTLRTDWRGALMAFAAFHASHYEPQEAVYDLAALAAWSVSGSIAGSRRFLVKDRNVERQTEKTNVSGD